MNQERLIWQGQLSEAEVKRAVLEQEAQGIIRQMRMDLNPMIDLKAIDTTTVFRQAQRLDQIRLDLDEIAIQIQRLREYLG